MKKKLLLCLLVLTVSVFIVGCGKKEEKLEDDFGSWKTDLTTNQEMLEENVLDIFLKANEKVEENYDYVAVLGTQVVAGTNYMFLVKESGKYKVIVIYNDLEGNAEITKVTDFKPEKYANKKNEVDHEQLAGGWTTTIPGKPFMLEENVQEYFDKATETLTGATYYPIAQIAHQEVAGMNYAILCYGRGSYIGSTEWISVLTIYVDKDGNNPELLTIADVDLKDYNK